MNAKGLYGNTALHIATKLDRIDIVELILKQPGIDVNAKDGKGGEVAAFSFNNKTGELQFINQQGTGGDHPCYVETDQTGQWVFAGNYTSGSLSVMPVLPGGAVGAFS